MRIFQAVLVTALVFGGTLSMAQGKASEADRESVDAACVTDAATAKCGTDKVGTGLLKCLHAYRKANPTYKFSAGCKTAMQTLRADRKAAK